MDNMKDQLSAVGRNAEEIKRTLTAMQGNRGVQNLTIVKIEGLGSVVLGICIGLAAWVAWALGDIRDEQRQHSAFISATYQAVPQLRAEFERIKAEQESNQ